MRLYIFIALVCGVGFQAGCGSLGTSLPTWQSTFAAGSGKSADKSDGKSAATDDPLNVDIPIARPTKDNPVTVGAAVSRTRVSPGEQIVLVVRCQTADPWYIYAADGATDVGVPTQLNLKLPPNVTQSSTWQLPDAAIKASPLGEISSYAGDFRFMIPLEISADATAAEMEIQCELAYQACSDATCLAPASQRLVIPLAVQTR